MKSMDCVALDIYTCSLPLSLQNAMMPTHQILIIGEGKKALMSFSLMVTLCA